MQTSYESNEPSSSDKLKSLLICHLEGEISKLKKYKNICRLVINMCEVESRRFFLVKGSKKRKIALNSVASNKKTLNDFEKSIAELQQCLDALNKGNKVHPEIFNFLNASDTAIEIYTKYLNDERGLVTTVEGNIVFQKLPLGKMLVNTDLL